MAGTAKSGVPMKTISGNESLRVRILFYHLCRIDNALDNIIGSGHVMAVVPGITPLILCNTVIGNVASIAHVCQLRFDLLNQSVLVR